MTRALGWSVEFVAPMLISLNRGLSETDVEGEDGMPFESIVFRVKNPFFWKIGNRYQGMGENDHSYDSEPKDKSGQMKTKARSQRWGSRWIRSMLVTLMSLLKIKIGNKICIDARKVRTCGEVMVMKGINISLVS